MSTELLQGKICIITGAASGIGRASAELFAAEGAHVVGVDRDLDRLREVALGVTESGNRMDALYADLTLLSDIQNVYSSFIEDFGRVDCIFSNAGVPGDKGWRFDPDRWRTVIDLNLTAAIALTDVFSPVMREAGGGSIVFNASVSGLVASPNSPTYSAAKAGVIGYTRGAAAALGPDGIRVNSVCPAPTNTPMLPRFFDDDESRGDSEIVQRRIDRYVENIPLRRLADPLDVAQAALFLASDQSRYITGTALPVDGGYSAV